MTKRERALARARCTREINKHVNYGTLLMTRAMSPFLSSIVVESYLNDVASEFRSAATWAHALLRLRTRKEKEQ